MCQGVTKSNRYNRQLLGPFHTTCVAIIIHCIWPALGNIMTKAQHLFPFLQERIMNKSLTAINGDLGKELGIPESLKPAKNYYIKYSLFFKPLNCSNNLF